MTIELVQGDITKLKVEGIVNAANTSLLGGGGVDGAIHKAGGKEILDECVKIRNRQGGCKVGEAVYTNAGKLEAKFVIHTVGPRWNNGRSQEDIKLENCYKNVMRIAEELKLKSIAIPNISTGIYKYPKSAACKIAVKVVSHHKPTSIEKVVFVCFDNENYKLYEKEING